MVPIYMAFLRCLTAIAAESEGLASLIPEEDPTKQFKARFQRFFHLYRPVQMQALSLTCINEKTSIYIEALNCFAESEGFEPSVPLRRDNGFRDRPIQPLWQLSLMQNYDFPLITK